MSVLLASAALHGPLAYVVSLLARHGYLIILLFVASESFFNPIPGEVSLLAGSYLAARGRLDLTAIIVVGALAAVAGDNAGYLFGRRAGRPLLERLAGWLHVRRRRLRSMDEYFASHAGKTVFVARWVSPLRGWTALSAGASHVSWPRFFLFNTLACVTWATCVSLLGYFFASRLARLAGILGLAGGVAAGLIVATIIVFVLIRRRRRRARQVQGLDHSRKAA